MEPLPPRAAHRATGVLVALRVGYAYNWFSVGPALPAIGATFSVGPAAWGVLVAVFLAGAGAMQLPAGLLARRYGPRRISLLGVALLSVAALGSAAAPSFSALLAARLLAGVGAGLFFSPAIGLVASLYPDGRRGVPVGIFSSAFSLGAALGILGSSLLVPAFGWPVALAAGGAALGVTTLLAFGTLPAAAGAPEPARPPPGIPAAFRLRAVWAVGVAFVGFEGATFAATQFVVPWGESVLGWSALLAGAVGMVFVLPSVAGGPVGGSFAERFHRPRTQFVVAAVAAGAVLAVLPYGGLLAAVGVGSVFAFAYGFVYAVMYVIPYTWAGLPRREVPLAIGLFNAVQLAGGAGISALFGWLVAVRGYAVAWPALGGMVVLTLGALAALPRGTGAAPGRRAAARAAPPPGPGP